MEDILKGCFEGMPDILYGYSRVENAAFASRYPTALVIAVPYGERLTPEDYTEARFDAGITAAAERLAVLLPRIERVLEEASIPYYIPETAQKDETGLMAEFSFKFAAVRAGLGWIGKNGVLITERCGPRVRLSAVLMGAELPCGRPVTDSLCGECCLCVDACPAGVIRGVTWTPDALREDLLDFHRCNSFRSGFLPLLGRKSACGRCMVICPWGMEK